MLVGEAKNVYLIPETSIVLSTMLMKRINQDEFITPSFSIKEMYEKAGIAKVAVSFNGNGFTIAGEPYESIRQISGMPKNAVLNATQARGALAVMGMPTERSNQTLLEAAYRFTKKASLNPVLVYGVRSDYISTDSLVRREKLTQFQGLLKEAAATLRKDLVKEASALDDPESVDVVLSLNFVNEDNLIDYIDNIGIMKKIISKLASMLIASRMGLAEIDEGAVKKAMEGLDSVVTGLENIKIAIGK
jgi:hypothetical protein